MVLAIYNEANEGAFLSFKSIFYNALGLFEFECVSSLDSILEPFSTKQ